MYKDFGRWLKANRKKHGWTQKDLASRTTYSYQYISQRERADVHNESKGQVQPSKRFIAEVAAAFADTPAQRDLLEREGRILAGWPEKDEIPTYEEIKRILQENPGKGILLPGSGEGHLVVVDTRELANQIAAILKEAKLSVESDTQLKE